MIDSSPDQPHAFEIAHAIRSGQTTAVAVTETALSRIQQLDGAINSFTTVTAERALAAARAVDARIAAGVAPGPLAGVPFAVKNLFDIRGVTTVAGSRINRELAPAAEDATLIRRLEGAGAILVGALHMGEYAYDFTGRNAHDGPCRNPHDLARMTGGSSSGSGAAVAAGLVPIALGSDTNGSIRVPAALCGTFGLKPTYGRLGRGGTFPFVDSLDHLGPLARSVRDLALAYDAMQGPDPADHACTTRPPEPATPSLDEGVGGVRIAVADGYFAERARPEVLAAVEGVAQALGVSRRVTIPDAARARAAAFLITATEGANLHRERLRTRPGDYDLETRGRFLAGSLIPGDWYVQAQRFRGRYREQLRQLFRDEVDVVLAPATPLSAPLIEDETMDLDGTPIAIRPNLGIFTQPISFAGLPVCSVPVWNGRMPVGVQIIAAPWAETTVLRVAAHLERTGAVRAPVATTR